MTKVEFFLDLEKNLSDIPASESNKVIDFYQEYFEEAAEAGKPEEEILGSIETPDKIAARVKAEAVFTQAESKPSISNWIKVMIAVLGVFALPIAFPIAISVFAVLFAMFVAVFSVLFAVGIAVIAVIAAGVALFASGIGLLLMGGGAAALGKAGAGLLLVGLAIFLAVGIAAAAKAMILLTTHISKSIYNRIAKKVGKKK
jgi:uncharacterized membrane protein